VFGGSTAAGFGVGGHRFTQLVAARLELEELNLAGTGALLDHTVTVTDGAADCEVVIAMHGMGEALVRPPQRALRLMPRRWRRRGWMDPRAYYSSRLQKRIPQRIESAVRWRVKVALIRLTGGEQLMPRDEFAALHARFLDSLRHQGVPTIVVVGSPLVDERYFPHSLANGIEYEQIAREQAEAAGAIFVSSATTLDRWDDYFLDHLHPTAAGHARLAERVLEALEAAGGAERDYAEAVA